jgi:hypothetical protein
MRKLKDGKEANQIHELNINTFNSLVKRSQFVIVTQQATFRLLPSNKTFTHKETSHI